MCCLLGSVCVLVGGVTEVCECRRFVFKGATKHFHIYMIKKANICQRIWHPEVNSKDIFSKDYFVTFLKKEKK